MIVLRWESLKDRINSIIINISGKPAITVSVLIEEDIVSPLRLHVKPSSTPSSPTLSEPPLSPTPETASLEEMIVDDQLETVEDSPMPEGAAAVAESPKDGKEKRKRGSIMSRFSFKKSKRDAGSPKPSSPKKKSKKGSFSWTAQKVDATLQQMRLTSHWVKFKLVRSVKRIKLAVCFR